MSVASIAIAVVGGIFFGCSAWNWWAAHDHPSGDQEHYMDIAVAFGLAASVSFVVGWAVA